MENTFNNFDQSRVRIKETILSYYQLTKPRIIPLLLITTAASMWLAANGQPSPVLMIMTMLGGTLAAASAQTLNCIYDRDIDYQMERTRKRPIPAGKIKPFHALIFAAILAILSFIILSVFANLLTAFLALSGLIFYMGIYTHLLKRHTSQNIVIGGAAGSIPALVGHSAVTGDLNITAWLLFALVFLWTPPHFWALSLMIKDDYAQVNVPMLPVVAGEAETAKQIWYYSLLLIPASFLLIYPLAATGAIYAIFALSLGIILLQKSRDLLANPIDRQLAKSLFKYSILYMMLLCTGIVIDSLPIVQSIDRSLINNFQLILQQIPIYHS